MESYLSHSRSDLMPLGMDRANDESHIYIFKRFVRSNVLTSLLLFALVLLEPIENPAAASQELKKLEYYGANNQTETGHFESLRDTASARNKCEFAERELDRCSAQLISMGQSDIIMFPNSLDDINLKYCPNFRRIVGCIKNSTECYKPFERQIINWILTSTRKMNYKRCKNETEKVKFLRLTNSCLSLMKDPVDKCMSNYIANLEAIEDFDKFIERLSEDDFHIQLSCCANRRFKQCVMKNVMKHCKPWDSLKKLRRTSSISSRRIAQKQVQRAVQDMMEDLKSTLDGMALTGPEFVCQSVDDEFCRARFDGRFEGRAPRHRSIVPAMLKIYSNRS